MKSSKQNHPITTPLTISTTKIDGFTTLLQSGIKLPAASGISLGVFLNSLPGFDIDYVSDTVQTIFLDGNALDDLEQPLTSQDHVIALSAAMPGLAGAIFRRNSLCAALRTRSENLGTAKKSSNEIFVLLKLFNSIAQEKGEELLRPGGIFSGETLRAFFNQRPSLLDAITSIHINGKMKVSADLLTCVSRERQYYLKIISAQQQDTH
jgi:hypothetical protein